MLGVGYVLAVAKSHRGRARTVDGPVRVARLSAFAQSVGYLISVPGPIIVGVLYERTAGWRSPLAFLAVLMVMQVDRRRGGRPRPPGRLTSSAVAPILRLWLIHCPTAPGLRPPQLQSARLSGGDDGAELRCMTLEDGVGVEIGMIHFACRDVAALAGFWSAVLEQPVDEGASGDLAMINAAHKNGPITWIFQRGDELPAGVNRVSVDLTSEDWQAQADRFQSAGATRLGTYDVGGVRWVELTDIEGNLFRIFAPRQA